MRKPRGKTGPTTPEGKQISSRNASKHNCTSTRLIVEGEDPAEFAALLESLTAEYQPETTGQQITVNEAARAAWELARANREFDKSQQALFKQHPNMREWNSEQQSECERMLRYRTRAERAYGRLLKSVEYIRKLHLQAGHRAFWENLQQEHLNLSKKRLALSAKRLQIAAEPKAAPKEKDKPARVIDWPNPIVPISQIIEIRALEGAISIRAHPQTEDMYRLADTVRPGARVVRRFEFPSGIPAQYAWVNAPDIRRAGIVWEQHFATVQAWRAQADWEAAKAPGHYLPPKEARWG